MECGIPVDLKADVSVRKTWKMQEEFAQVWKTKFANVFLKAGNKEDIILIVLVVIYISIVLPAVSSIV